MAIYDSQTQSKSKRNSRRFRDIDLDFGRNVVTNDVNVVEDVIAVKRAVKNLVQTNFYERPFQPELGCDIFNILFEPATEDLSSDIDASIRESVGKWLPHVSLKGVMVDVDNNTVNITVTFSIVTDPNATESISLALNRVGV